MEYVALHNTHTTVPLYTQMICIAIFRNGNTIQVNVASELTLWKLCLQTLHDEYIHYVRIHDVFVRND